MLTLGKETWEGTEVLFSLFTSVFFYLLLLDLGKDLGVAEQKELLEVISEKTNMSSVHGLTIQMTICCSTFPCASPGHDSLPRCRP